MPAVIESRESRRSKIGLAISREHDLPLLLLIRDSTYICRSQIGALAPIHKITERPTNTTRRLKRLAAYGYILAEEPAPSFRGAVYSITAGGLLCLEKLGYCLASVTSRSEVIAKPRQVLHLLELVSLRITLSSLYTVTEWLTDRQVSGDNLLADEPTAKDYDAIATYTNPELEGGIGRFAIEYERTIKDDRRYEEIRSQLKGETSLSCLIYFVDGSATAKRIADKIYSTNVWVGVVDRADFEMRHLEARARFKSQSGIKEATLSMFIKATSTVPGVE